MASSSLKYLHNISRFSIAFLGLFCPNLNGGASSKHIGCILECQEHIRTVAFPDNYSSYNLGGIYVDSDIIRN